eukprot:6681792-Prymnesium_polylepis.1
MARPPAQATRPRPVTPRRPSQRRATEVATPRGGAAASKSKRIPRARRQAIPVRHRGRTGVGNGRGK